MGTLKLLLQSHTANGFPCLRQGWKNRVKPLSGGTGSKQSTISVAGIDNWYNKEHLFFTEIAPLPMGMDVATALYLLINRVDEQGEVSFDTTKQSLNVDWDKNNTIKMRKNAD